jgi:hypothetical protein
MTQPKQELLWTVELEDGSRVQRIAAKCIEEAIVKAQAITSSRSAVTAAYWRESSWERHGDYDG